MPKQAGDGTRSRSGLQNVAASAGVGIATVDRVLNDRGGVSPDTARRVLLAARQLGLRRALPVSHHKGIWIAILLTGRTCR